MIIIPSVVLCLLLNPTTAPTATPTSTVAPLAAGRAVERATESFTDDTIQDQYRFDADAGSVVEIVAEQRRLDVSLTLIAPDGQELLTLDSPTGDTGVETLFAVVDVRGEYRLVVAATARDGGYSLRRTPARPATRADRVRAAAVRATATADALHVALTPEASPEQITRVETAWKRAIEGWRAVDDRSAAARAWLQLGVLHEGRHDDLARHAFEQALGLEPSGTSITRAAAEGFLGSIAFRAGRLADAFAHFDREVTLRKGLDHPDRTVISLHNRARVRTLLGDLEGALLDYQRSLTLGRETTGELTATRVNRGRLLFTLGRVDDAASDLDAALARAQLEHPSDIEAAALAGLGLIALHRGELDLAESRLIDARRLETDAMGKAQRDLDLATIHARRGQGIAAQERLARALDTFHEHDRPFEWAIAGYRLGKLAIEQADTAGGEEWMRRVASVLDQAPNAGPQPRADLHVALARLARQRGDLTVAERHLGRATAAIEQFRSRRDDPALRFEILRDAASLYAERVDVLMALHRTQPTAGHHRRALAESERARSRDLLDRLVDRVEPRGSHARDLATQVRGIADDLLQRHVERARLVRYPEAAAAETLLRLDAEIARLSRLHARLAPALDEAAASYAELVRHTPLDVEALQALVDRRTALCVLGSFGERAVAWVIRHDRLVAFDLGRPDRVEQRAAEAYERVATPPTRRGKVARQRALKRLGTILVEPIASSIADADRLVLVADGVLADAPFAALPWRSGEPLSARFELVHLPSASTLGWLRRRTSDARPEDPLVMVADPTYDLDPRCPDAVPTGSGLSRLQGTGIEAGTILGHLKSTTAIRLLGFEADRDRALAALPQARIAHFAVHAEAINGPKGLPGLHLAERDPRCRPIDGRLDVEAILGLELRAALVVLSGCETALGETVDGEGRIGLIRSFLYAGAERVIASRWPVDDDATARLMIAFYDALLVDGQTPAAALRSAQLALRDQPGFSEPYFWAAFDAFGDWR